jgi:peptidyl-prolyl cis-trans isomerase D
MFDLFRRKDTAVRYVLMGLLGLVAVSMVVTLIPGFGTGGSGPSEQILAEVGGSPVYQREASARIEQSVRQSGVPRNMAYVVANNVLDELLQQKVLEYQAKRMGLQVSDAELAAEIQKFVPALFPNGQFVGRDAYASFLGQRGMTPADFESRVRAQMLVSRVAGLVSEGMIVTPAEIEAEYRRNNDKIKVEFIAIKPADLRKQITVTDAEVKAEYEKDKAGLKTQERRMAALFSFDEARIAASVQPNEADLRRAYDEQRDRWRTGERLKVRHILLKTTGKTPAEADKLQARMADLLKQVKGGADFAELAKKNSEDTTSAVNGGDLGFIVRGQTVKNFEDAAFALKPKEISNIVKTEYGFHILQLMEREDARVKPFEEAKAELAAETMRQVVFDKMQRSADALRTYLARNPEKADEAAKLTGADLVFTPMMTQAQPQFPGTAPDPELVAQIFSLPKGGVSSVTQAQGNKLMVAMVTGIEPSRQSTLEETAADLRRQLEDARTGQLADRKARELSDRARQAGADFKKLAAEFGGEWKSAPEFNRSGAIEGIGSGAMLSALFGKPVGAVSDPVSNGQDRFVARLAEVMPASLEKLASERESVLKAINDRRGRERSELFTDGLMEALRKEGKVKIFDENRKRLLASFGSGS